MEIKQGTIIAVGGNLYEYYSYNTTTELHVAYEIMVDEDGRLTITYTPFIFTNEELKDNAVNFTQNQWYGIVEHFIRQDYELTEFQIKGATMDIVDRCFAYGIPTIEALPEYIAEYLNR